MTCIAPSVRLNRDMSAIQIANHLSTNTSDNCCEHGSSVCGEAVHCPLSGQKRAFPAPD